MVIFSSLFGSLSKETTGKDAVGQIASWFLFDALNPGLGQD